MSDLIPRDAREIVRQAEQKHLLDTSNDSTYSLECLAAQESIDHGLYVTWVPSTFATIPASATDEIKSGIGQCCRIGSQSLCQCGHVLSNHQIPKVPKKRGYIKPPPCTNCRTCKQFTYSPSHPEECGQWWLRRRRDFDIREWRKRVRLQPAEYACIGCNLKITDHETIFETKEDRISRGAAVDESYIPLHDYRNVNDSEAKK
jgi:hypothetical protein